MSSSFSTSFISYWELVYELTLREVRARYKQSILGYAWVVIAPLCQMLVMSFVFSSILRVPDQGLPYSLFLYTALLPWTLLTQSLSSSTAVLVNQAKLISKIYFPRNVLIVSTILAKLADFALASLVWMAFFWYFHIPLTWNVLWFFPLFGIQLLLTYGLSLFLAAANLFYRDIQYLLNLVLIIWMYLTPVVYAMEFVPTQYRGWFMLNPMAFCVEAYRSVLLLGKAPDMAQLVLATAISGCIAFIGWLFFRKLESMFADFV